MSATWLIHMCGMTHSYVWLDSFVGEAWLIHMRDVTWVLWHMLAAWRTVNIGSVLHFLAIEEGNVSEWSGRRGWRGVTCSQSSDARNRRKGCFRVWQNRRGGRGQRCRACEALNPSSWAEEWQCMSGIKKFPQLVLWIWISCHSIQTTFLLQGDGKRNCGLKIQFECQQLCRELHSSLAGKHKPMRPSLPWLHSEMVVSERKNLVGWFWERIPIVASNQLRLSVLMCYRAS